MNGWKGKKAACCSLPWVPSVLKIQWINVIFVGSECRRENGCFHCLCPISWKKHGYMADVTRHGKDAPGGVTETQLMMPSRSLKREGHWLNGGLGVTPRLPVLILDSKTNGTSVRFIYDHLNDCYGYRDLYQAKENTVRPNGFRPIMPIFTNTSDTRHALCCRR